MIEFHVTSIKGSNSSKDSHCGDSRVNTTSVFKRIIGVHHFMLISVGCCNVAMMVYDAGEYTYTTLL